MKLARNHVLDNDMCLNPDEEGNEQVVNRAPYEELARLTTQDLSPYTLDLTHVQCQGHERQNVRKAMQLLSNSAARVLLEAGERKLIKCENFMVRNYFIKFCEIGVTLNSIIFDKIVILLKYSTQVVTARHLMTC